MTETQAQSDSTRQTFVISECTQEIMKNIFQTENKHSKQSKIGSTPDNISGFILILLFNRLMCLSKLVPVWEAEKLHFGWRILNRVRAPDLRSLGQCPSS